MSAAPDEAINSEWLHAILAEAWEQGWDANDDMVPSYANPYRAAS